ncbi:MAG: ribonuclease III [Candidatus Paceibacteria bacterium]
MHDFTKLQKAIGYTFSNSELLLEAVTHRSYLNESDSHPVDHNERLEFLGDAVLELVVTEYLFHQYPNKPEGELTNYRSALVKGEHLAKVAAKFNLGDYLLISKGEAADERSRAYITANAVESLIAAIYLDSSLAHVSEFIHTFIIPDLPKIIEQKLFIDAKSLLQEKIQEYEGKTPQYALVQEWGPDHDKRFEIAVYIGEEQVATGVGGSKQKGEQEAARQALKAKNIN